MIDDRTEEKLRELLELYRLVGRATNDTIWDWCLVTDRVVYSEAAQTMFGYAADEIGVGDNWWTDRVHPDDIDRVNDVVKAVLSAGDESWSVEYRFRCGDGTYADVLERGFVVRNERGEATRMIGSMQNVTDRKRVEVAQRFLAESSRLLSSSLDIDETIRSLTRLAVPCLADFCIVDLRREDGGMVRVAWQCADPAKEAVMEAARDYPVQADRVGMAAGAASMAEPLLMAEVTDAFIEAVAYDDTHLRIMRNLGLRSLMVLPLMARGRMLGVLTFSSSQPGRYGPSDLELAAALAERASLAIDNAQLYRKALEASQAKSNFLAVMSHEFRTPLTAVIGYAELLEGGVSGPTTPRQREHLGHIKSSAWHLLRLIEEILLFARTDAADLTLARDHVMVADLLRDVAGIVDPVVREKGIELRVELAESVREIETDCGKLRQILLNILSNAVKFTDTGVVVLSVFRDGEEIVFEVSDTGIGIAPEHLDRIFEPFWQADQSVTRRRGGTGLGLSVTRELAHRLGGGVTVERREEGGSIFRVRIPGRCAEATSPSAVPVVVGA